PGGRRRPDRPVLHHGRRRDAGDLPLEGPGGRLRTGPLHRSDPAGIRAEAPGGREPAEPREPVGDARAGARHLLDRHPAAGPRGRPHPVPAARGRADVHREGRAVPGGRVTGPKTVAADSRGLAATAARAASSKQAERITVIDVRELITITDYFVICS